MKKTVLAFILVLASFTLITLSVSAAESPRLLDTAGLLDEYESETVLSMLDEVSERQDMDIVILTADTLSEGMTVEQEATGLYEYLGYSEDGVMLYICMDDGYGRSWYILTSGYGITALTDAGIEYIADNFLYLLSDGSYGYGFEEFIRYTDSFITRAKSGTPYDAGDMPVEPFNPLFALAASLIVGFVVALIITGIWRGQLKSVSRQSRAASYMRPGSLTLTNTRDIFLYRNVTRTERPRNNSSGSGGGSSTHRSSSGRTYGGRGGRF